MSEHGDEHPLNLPIVEPGSVEPLGESTRAVHTPRRPPPRQRPIGLPVYRTSAFVFDSAEDYTDILGDRKPGSLGDRPSPLCYGG